MKKLCADSNREREQATVELIENATLETLIAVSQVLFNDISMETHAACLDILETHEVSLSLENVAQDGWIDEVKAETKNFHVVTRIVGERYLAYSLLLGLQIQSIKRNEDPNTDVMVQFTSDSDMVQTLPLTQFNRLVTSVLLSIGIRASARMEMPLTEAQAIELIGELPLLTAPLFGISLKRLIAIQQEERCFAVLGLATPSGHVYLELADFHNIIVRLIQSDLQKLGQENLEFDLNIEPARQAFEEQNYDGVISQLQTWPGLLTTLLKSPAKKQLDDTQLQRIAEGTRLLAEAYRIQQNFDWAQETLRLGLRYVCDTDHAGELYLQFGQLQNQTQKYGEAIGYLRRALALNTHICDAYSELAYALYHLKKKWCAFLLLKEVASRVPLSAPMQQLFLELQRAVEEKEISWPS